MLVRLTGNKMEKKINYIPAVLSLNQKKVGIYCRVSTNSTEQLNSLSNQISHLVVFDENGQKVRKSMKYSSKKKEVSIYRLIS